ncbi:DUF4123 domain-containing protein [Duganella sp. FT80W]|uniref:DUF4123 domain-containing protein n=1 Tax=Duganella guangzhouensis TaxID=2666084 RepID=A0A6I2L3I1_9BURK|nr:DUF4123 domain-containing protein [Duganella guangzhouensis]MRW92688.1 DUF4123 domain-containing protein [Duganella guangzhouensis]
MQPIPDPCADIATGYLLVDVSNLPELDCEAIKMVGCVPPALANSQELMPCLIAVHEMSGAQRDQVLRMLKYQRAGEHPYAICAWLDCDLGIDDLAVHIGSYLCGCGPDGVRVFWRYFDPRVFATAMALFSPLQRDALLGPIKCWRFVWCRSWWNVTRTVTRSESLSDFLAGWPTEPQWPRLLQSRTFNRILDKLGEDEALAPVDCLRYQEATLAYLADDEISSHLNEDDLAEFGYLCSRYGAAYRHHEKLRHGWDALQRGEMSWTDVRFLLDKSDYARLDLSRASQKGISKWC